VRPDLLAAAAPRSSFTQGNGLDGQCVTSAAGDLWLRPMPGLPLAAGAMLIELPYPRGACWISLSYSLLSQVWRCLSWPAPATRVAGAAARTWM
jgi:hypothetical protein